MVADQGWEYQYRWDQIPEVTPGFIALLEERDRNLEQMIRDNFGTCMEPFEYRYRWEQIAQEPADVQISLLDERDRELEAAFACGFEFPYRWAQILPVIAAGDANGFAMLEENDRTLERAIHTCSCSAFIAQWNNSNGQTISEIAEIPAGATLDRMVIRGKCYGYDEVSLYWTWGAFTSDPIVFGDSESNRFDTFELEIPIGMFMATAENMQLFITKTIDEDANYVSIDHVTSQVVVLSTDFVTADPGAGVGEFDIEMYSFVGDPTVPIDVSETEVVIGTALSPANDLVEVELSPISPLESLFLLFHMPRGFPGSFAATSQFDWNTNGLNIEYTKAGTLPSGLQITFGNEDTVLIEIPGSGTPYTGTQVTQPLSLNNGGGGWTSYPTDGSFGDVSSNQVVIGPTHTSPYAVGDAIETTFYFSTPEHANIFHGWAPPS